MLHDDKKHQNCKLDTVFSFRLPNHLKSQFHKLSTPQKQEAEYELRLVIAKAIHNAKFREEDYLEE